MSGSDDPAGPAAPLRSGMKVRVGFGLGTATSSVSEGGFAELVAELEATGWDSLWLSEQLNGPAPDPLSALAFAAGRTERLKLGTAVTVVPGRNPVVLAKQMATIDRLSGGRFLPAVGLGTVRPVEQSAFGVAREDRAAWFDEALGLMRRLWSGEVVTHRGERFHLDDVSVGPEPVQEPLEVWLGGRAPSELRRVGRLGDGWLPSFCTADDVARGWEVLTTEASAHGRVIDPQHLGALVAYSPGRLEGRLQAALERRLGGRPVELVVPAGLGALRDRLQEFMAVGASKFVVVPLSEPSGPGAWRRDLAEAGDALLDLQS